MRSAEFSFDNSLAESERDADNTLKHEVSARLAAHRSRRDRASAPSPTVPERPQGSGRTNRIAAAVAERYAHSQSYRDFLAAEAQRAIDEANAAAEIAARNAEAVSLAQQQLLAELDQWSAPPSSPIALVPAPEPEFVLESEPEPVLELALVPPRVRSRRYAAEPHPTTSLPPTAAEPDSGLTVRLYEDFGRDRPSAGSSPSSRAAAALQDPFDEDENFALDEEIEFRQTPVFEEPAGPTVPLPANLIEFPRQLVAPRKSRPRFAEGPLREDSDASPATAQLRIFEVETAQISSTPVIDSPLPEWSSICLETPRTQTIEVDETPFVLPPQAAPLNLRLMAAAVDACVLGAAFFSFVTVAALSARQLPTGASAAIAGGGILLLLFLLYRTLFFTLSEATPGMRYARIALCTFADENPTRSAMRRRTWALLLSACPLGIGFLWACLDDDRLGWHDRISRMYQRSY
jgi:RDD family